MSTKTYEAKIHLKSGIAPIPVTVQARNIPEARRLIEAQYAGQFKRFAQGPLEARK